VPTVSAHFRCLWARRLKRNSSSVGKNSGKRTGRSLHCSSEHASRAPMITRYARRLSTLSIGIGLLLGTTWYGLHPRTVLHILRMPCLSNSTDDTCYDMERKRAPTQLADHFQCSVLFCIRIFSGTVSMTPFGGNQCKNRHAPIWHFG